MIDSTRALRPLEDAARAIQRLDSYQSTAELGASVVETRDAVESTLRQLLRSDTGAPDELRLSALSPADLPSSRLITAVRERNLISIELAGMIHELDTVAERAGRDEVRAADADLASRVVDQMKTEILMASERPVRAVAHAAVESGALHETAHAVPRSRRRRWKRIVPVPIALTIVVVIAVWAARRESDLDRGITAFQADRLDQAEQHFLEAADGREGTTARLYLARIYRRQDRNEDAANELREAVRLSPEDPAVRRELGKLFLDLQRPEQAAEQLRRAQELEPDNSLNWIYLIRALRLAGDPQAEQLLQQAPAEAQAALRR